MAKSPVMYAALLRGINVSGQKPIKMSALAALFESLGYSEVETYIQSGNVVFGSPRNSSSGIAEAIESGIKKTFGYDVAVVVRRFDELDSIIRACPFIGRSAVDHARIYVTFLSSLPSRESCEKLLAISLKNSTDEFIISGEEIYVHCPNGYGNTQLSNTFFEKNLKIRSTTRNWKTVTTLSSMAGGAASA